jgi:ATP-dependent RNA helicase RhlE
LTEFKQLGLEHALLDALTVAGYTQPTPIQTLAIPPVLRGRDLLGIAATGTGKTAAFALPILQRMSHGERATRGTCRALVLAPTRELASQIAESFRTYGRNLRLTTAVVVGGVSARPQEAALAKGVDILVATPGRLIDHMGAGIVRLSDARVLVLDEADHMLDLGFIPAVRRIVGKMPRDRQTLLFSATMPREIRALADDFLHDPETVSAAPPATLAERIDQRVVHVETARKAGFLAGLLSETGHGRALVFTRTKRGADRVAKSLAQAGIKAVAIHGNKSQSQRERALAGFRAGFAPVLVATDIAARGIDVDGIELVVNYDLPNVPETYVHRIGRTARAGAAGKAIAFCTPEERPLLRGIEALTRTRIPGLAGEVPVATPAARDSEAALAKARRTEACRRQSRHSANRPRPSANPLAGKRETRPKHKGKPAAQRPGPRHGRQQPRSDIGPHVEDLPFMRT